MDTIRYSSFYEMLSAQEPSSPAIQCPSIDGQLTLSYQDLLRKIDELPLPKEGTIGLFCDGSIDCVIAIFALAKAGKTIVMLSPMEAPEVMAKQIAASEVEALLGPKPLVDAFSSYVCPMKKRDPSILFFTSGTTSATKAVVLTEKSLCASAYNGSALLPLEKGDRLLSLLPLSHVFGFVCCLLWPLSCGACVCLGRGIRHMHEDPAFYRPTVMSLVPQLAGFFLLRGLYNPECRLILIGAGGCKKEILQGIKAKGIRVSFGYGLTETSSGVALSLGDDPEAMTVCPDDEIVLAEDGEIRIHAPTCLFQGYYNRPEDTAAAMDGEYLLTGDLGRYDEEGKLHIVGRKKDILVLDDGTKVFCPEYEDALSPYVRKEDFAIALKNGKIVLFVGKSEGTDEALMSRIDQFNQTKPRNQQIVRVEYVQGALPRTQTGKVKRYLLSRD